MAKPSPEIEEIVKEVEDDFDLDDLLNNRSHVDSTLRLYTDEKAGKELGGAEAEKGQFGFGTRRRWGILGEIDALSEVIERAEKALGAMDDGDARALIQEEVDEANARVVELGKKAGPLIEKMNRSAIDLEIQSLPPVIIKDCRRRARAALEIKGKVSEADTERYMEQFNNEILVACVGKYTLVGNGKSMDGITVAQAAALYDKLPQSEVDKLDGKINEIVFKSSIAQEVGLNSDF